MIEHLASLVAEQIWQLAAQGLGAGLSWTALGNVHWVHNFALDTGLTYLYSVVSSEMRDTYADYSPMKPHKGTHALCMWSSPR